MMYDAIYHLVGHINLNCHCTNLNLHYLDSVLCCMKSPGDLKTRIRSSSPINLAPRTLEGLKKLWYNNNLKELDFA